MNVLGFVISVVAPLIAGFTMRFWFWKLPGFKHLKAKARDIDATELEITPPKKVREIRNSEGLGDKLVLSHYMVRVVSDLERKIREWCIATTICVALLGVLVAFAVTTKSPGASGPDGLPIAPLRDVTRSTFDLLNTWLLLPTTVVFFVVTVFTYGYRLHEEAIKLLDSISS